MAPYSARKNKKLYKVKKFLVFFLPHCNFGDMFFPSLRLCNCTSLSDASQHIWYIDKFLLSVFSSWLFPGNVQERGGGRCRRQAESRPSFPDGLYHIDWLVKYISYHIKPALGHDISSGRKLWVSQRFLENSCKLLLQLRKITVDLLHVVCSLKVATAPGSGWFLGSLWAIKSNCKHGVFYSKHPLSFGSNLFQKEILLVTNW